MNELKQIRIGRLKEYDLIYDVIFKSGLLGITKQEIMKITKLEKGVSSYVLRKLQDFLDIENIPNLLDMRRKFFRVIDVDIKEISDIPNYSGKAVYNGDR